MSYKEKSNIIQIPLCFCLGDREGLYKQRHILKKIKEFVNQEKGSRKADEVITFHSEGVL